MTFMAEEFRTVRPVRYRSDSFGPHMKWHGNQADHGDDQPGTSLAVLSRASGGRRTKSRHGSAERQRVITGSLRTSAAITSTRRHGPRRVADGYSSSITTDHLTSTPFRNSNPIPTTGRSGLTGELTHLLRHV